MRWKHILAATDFSEYAVDALELAGWVASEEGGRLTMLHAFDPDERACSTRDYADMLRALHISDLPDVAIQTRIIASDNPANAICTVAEEEAVDLVVVGTMGRTAEDHSAKMGRVAERVVMHAPCRVLTVPSAFGPRLRPLRVLVTTDMSAANAPVCADASEIQRRWNAHVTVLHVQRAVDAAHEQRLREILISQCHQHFPSAGVRAELIVTDVPIADAIVDYARAQRFDLVMVASHGRTHLARFAIGRVAERVARCAHCPVWMTRTPGRLLDASGTRAA